MGTKKTMRLRRTAKGATSTMTAVIAAVVAVVVVLVLWLVLKDNGKDDQPNRPGIISLAA